MENKIHVYFNYQSIIETWEKKEGP